MMETVVIPVVASVVIVTVTVIIISGMYEPDLVSCKKDIRLSCQRY